MQKLTESQLKALGAVVTGSQMDNGEHRVALMAADGSGFSRATMPASRPGGWQNAHYHGAVLRNGDEPGDVPGVFETVVVHVGWIGVAYELLDGTRGVRVLKPGGVWIFPPGVMHNTYMSSGTEILWLKYGKPVPNPERDGNDWWEAPDFDRWTKSLTESDIHRLDILN